MSKCVHHALVCRMVEISCSMKAQGVVLPDTRHFIPLGQYTSEEFSDCFLMLSREQRKQNLCEVVEGHCTKRVSSNVLWQSRHFMGTLSALEGEEGAAGLPAVRLDTGLADPLRVGEREDGLTLPLLQGLCTE